MSDLKIVIKGKGEEFAKNPEKVLKELGLLKEGEKFEPLAKAGKEPLKANGIGGHAHIIFTEGEASV